MVIKQYVLLIGLMILIVWIMAFLGVIGGMDVIGSASPV